jgi:hypothetical protein
MTDLMSMAAENSDDAFVNELAEIFSPYVDVEAIKQELKGLGIKDSLIVE